MMHPISDAKQSEAARKSEKVVFVASNHISLDVKGFLDDLSVVYLPEAIAIELDRQRFVAMLSKDNKSPGIIALVRQIGLPGSLLFLLGRFVQSKLGKMTGVLPGQDMLAGAEYAARHRIPLLFIDRPINATMADLSHKMGLFKFLGLFFKFRKVDIKIDIKKVPSKEEVAQLIDLIKDVSPVMYDILITGRNKYMCRQLLSFVRQNPGKSVLVIVGAGHVPGMLAILKKHINVAVY